ncbi:PhzF family phenazine biosynthesis protein [Aliikangiella sp. IMCC44359]|uniref:PhzF family phenazine biosynthesis protein n=1 Tax=Aliikangiella sp. IMCC44359 TaxID=3459125 RepID=UPI00403B2A83
MKLKINIIDAFTDSVFKGNPAAVILLEDWLTEEQMQSIASENNLSETAFAKKTKENTFKIRWFSPITEIAFCGHATLATAFVIFNQTSDINEIIFETNSVGNLIIHKENKNIQMSFPNRAPQKLLHYPNQLIQGLSIKPLEVWQNEQAYFVIYNSENDVLEVKQNSEQLKALFPYDVVVTASSQKYDFVSRYFWPANGGDEDPVTGSIHAGLAPFWADRLNKTELLAYQASKRGGLVKCQILQNRILISGTAVEYLDGWINI